MHCESIVRGLVLATAVMTLVLTAGCKEEECVSKEELAKQAQSETGYLFMEQLLADPSRSAQCKLGALELMVRHDQLHRLRRVLESSPEAARLADELGDSCLTQLQSGDEEQVALYWEALLRILSFMSVDSRAVVQQKMTDFFMARLDGAATREDIHQRFASWCPVAATDLLDEKGIPIYLLLLEKRLGNQWLSEEQCMNALLGFEDGSISPQILGALKRGFFVGFVPSSEFPGDFVDDRMSASEEFRPREFELLVQLGTAGALDYLVELSGDHRLEKRDQAMSLLTAMELFEKLFPKEAGTAQADRVLPACLRLLPVCYGEKRVELATSILALVGIPGLSKVQLLLERRGASDAELCSRVKKTLSDLGPFPSAQPTKRPTEGTMFGAGFLDPLRPLDKALNFGFSAGSVGADLSGQKKRKQFRWWMGKKQLTPETFAWGVMDLYLRERLKETEPDLAARNPLMSPTDPRSLQVVKNALDSPCLWTRILAVTALRRMATAEAVELLLGVAVRDKTDIGAYLRGHTVSSLAANGAGVAPLVSSVSECFGKLYSSRNEPPYELLFVWDWIGSDMHSSAEEIRARYGAAVEALCDAQAPETNGGTR